MSSRVLTAVLLATLPLTGIAQEHDHGGAAGDAMEKLGRVEFPTSCDPKVQGKFERGVALLHSFWFEAGYRVFNEVLQDDPSCAMGYWAIAMNRLLNPFLGQPGPKFLTEGAAAAEKARALGAKTPRERDYIEAIGVLYQDAGKAPWRERVLAYEKAMAELAQRYPGDKEAAIFYALALNVAHDLNDKTYAKPLKAAAILEPLFAAHPDHPGTAHYLIHSYDYPPLAAKGLPAARRYAEIAPSSAHVLHMPSHIFTRVGAWEDSAATNRRSEEAVIRGAGVDEALHAIDYQVYAYLQLGQDGKAKRAIERVMAIGDKASNRPAGPFALAAVPARFALERGDWIAASQLQPGASPVAFASAITHFARAIGAARSGNPQASHPDLERLAALRDTLAERKNTYWAGQVEIQRLSASAWVALVEGRREEALKLMREAADMETKSEKAPISPGPIRPARELLGEMLLEIGQPALALKEFETSLEREPNRFRGLYGAALAAEAAGDRQKAVGYFAKLMALAKNADTVRPELAYAEEAYFARR